VARQVQITVDLDANGVQRRVRIVEREIERLNRANGQVQQTIAGIASAATGLDFLGNIYTSLAVAAGGFAKEAVQASLDGAAANRILSSSATSAGVAYTQASEGAKKFGQQLAVSNIEAQKTYSSLLTLTKNSGQSADIDRISERFADAAAAKGLKGDDISTLVSQLISGQDEALNRLGIKDPSGLYKEYAASVGRTVDSLSELERTRIRVTAVEQLGIDNAGAYLDRLQSVDGQVATISATFENLTQSIGDTITGSLEFREFLGTLNEGLKAISTSADDVRANLAKGLTPKQVAEQSKSGFLSGSADFINAAATQLFAESGAAKLLGFTDAEIDAATDPAAVHARRVADATRQIEDQQRKDSVQAAKAAAKEIQNAKDAAVAADLKLQGEYHKVEVKRAEEQGRRLADVYKRSADLIGNGASRLLTDNPFVKVFADAIKAAEQMREQYGVLGDDIVRKLDAIQQKATGQAILSARFDSSLNALGLRQQARSFERGFGGVSGADERSSSVGIARLGAAVEAAKLLREADRLEQQLQGRASGANPNKEALDTLDAIRFSALTTQSYVSDGARKAIQTALDQQIIAATENIDPSTVGNDPALRAAVSDRADALRRQAGGQQDAVQKAIEEARAGEQIVSDIRERIAKIESLRAGSGDLRTSADFAQGLADRSLLEEVNRLTENDRGEFRLAARDAALRQAERESRKEADAAAALEEERAFRKEIQATVQAGVDELNKGMKVILEFNTTTGTFEMRRAAGPATPGPVTDATK